MHRIHLFVAYGHPCDCDADSSPVGAYGYSLHYYVDNPIAVACGHTLDCYADVRL